MKKIMIVERDDGKGRELAHWLGTVFPECEIHVLKAAQSEDRQGEKIGLNQMRRLRKKSKNALFRHSGESRNQVFLGIYETPGPRFSTG